MSKPTSDTAAIRQTINALRAAGFTPYAVNDGGEHIPTTTTQEIIDAVTAVDAATLFVQSEEHGRGAVLFVLGNDPEETPADWSDTLEPVMAPLLDAWW